MKKLAAIRLVCHSAMLVGIVCGAAACEIIAAVDRTQIPAEEGDSVLDASGGTDAPSSGDATLDATLDASDTGTDGGGDGSSDADARSDAAESGAEAGGDGSADAPADGGCVSPASCPTPANECQEATCNEGVCGVGNKPAAATCNSGADVCDGNGACVDCLVNTDCPATGTVCATPQCTGNVCGTDKAGLGTVCSDNNGVVCDGNGTCVAQHCTDNVKDADETDVDCGGSSCGKCIDGKLCLAGTDCQSKVCSGTCQVPTCTDGQRNGAETDVDCGGAACNGQGKQCAVNKTCGGGADCLSGYCQGGTCQLKPDGMGCGGSGECANGNCVAGICCNTACNGTCQACTAALTGQPDGTCANMTAGQAAPAGQCTAAPPCGNTGNCAAGGVCEQESAASSCAASVCANGQLTPARTCSGSGTCGAASSAACAGGFVCASATDCKTACASDADCQNASDYCANPGPTGTCEAKLSPGGLCGGNNQCASGVCGVTGTGHCCSAACSVGVSGCSATDCDGAGACMFPGSSQAASSQTAGDCQKNVCNGAGGVTSEDDATDLPTANTLCLISPACSGAPLSPSFTPAPTGTDCTADPGPGSVCGDTSNPLIAGTCVGCNTAADCSGGTPTCNATTHVCE